MPTRLSLLTAVLLVACGEEAEKKTPPLAPGGDDQATVQEALIEAGDGDVVELAAGTFRFDGELSIRTKRNLTVRGQGPGTVLDFSGQTSGGNGIAVDGADGIVFEGLAIENTPGDGIRVENTTGVTFRDVKVSWDAGSESSNGAYALYPVRSRNILVEGCDISGASDAGIYVGQSDRAIVRNNRVHGNVAGIEIENTTDAEVVGNHVTDNAGGILVFNLPELQVKDGRRVLVHGNEVVANNHANFAAPGNIVASVPSGTGIVVLAADEIEVTDNEVRDNVSAGVIVTSFATIALVTGREYNDPAYDPYPETIHVHDNRMSGNGTEPRDVLLDLGGADVLWDGVVDATKDNPGGELSLCATANGEGATFLRLGPPISTLERSTDWSVVDCSHDPVPPVTL